MNLCSTVSLERYWRSRKEASIVLQTPYLPENRKQPGGLNRLWISTLNLPVNLDEYLERVRISDQVPLRQGELAGELLPVGLRHGGG